MDLIPRFVLGDLDLTDYPFSVRFGSDLGNPETETNVLASLLADGEVESALRRSNRTITLPILIEATDLGALAQAEALLIAECDKQRNTLTVNPGDGYAIETVFDTFAAQAVREYDDDVEQAGYRQWTLTIKALPFGRSTTKVIDDAGTPPSSGGTLLYNCESTTGWAPFSTVGAVTYEVDSVIYSEGAGSIRTLMASNNWDQGYEYHTASGLSADEVTGLSLSTGTGGYLAVDVRGDPANSYYLFSAHMQIAGAWIAVPSLVAVARAANGFITYAWPVDASLTVTGFRFMTHQSRPAQFVDRPYTWYDNIQLLPSATTDHQIVKQLEVGGSARTTGSLRISAPSEVVALGQVLTITSPTIELPAGFLPDGRRWVTQGTTTADATALDGSYFTPTTTYSSAAGYPIFDVPANMLTAGPYTMVALVKAESSSLTFGVQAQLRIGSTNTGPTSAAEVSLTGLTTGWQFVTVGTVYLPPLPMQGADASTKVRLLFKGAKFSNVYMIPAWQVGGRAVADFSIVDCGTGTVGAGQASSSLWIDSPSVSQPQGGWWRGPTTDRLNAQSAWPDAKKPGVHTFRPGSLTAFLVSTGAAGPTLALEYYPAWLGSAAS